jgi:hypothetical protein
MRFYSLILKLHLVKIKDHHDDLKSLVNDVTNNKTITKNIEKDRFKSTC